MRLAWIVILIVQWFALIHAKWVRDVDSSIVDEINKNPSVGYLIQFHAPWCGHCRKFEPIYEEIAKEVYDLSSTVDELKNIRIVRLDATVYTDVANRYDVRGYPTIKFVRGQQIFSYDNERARSAVLEFLRRVNGPALRWIPSIGKFNEIRSEHEVFFLLVTTGNGMSDDEEIDPLINQYKQIVNRYLSQAYFYATNASIIQQTYFAKYKSENSDSQVFAIKSEGFYLYNSDEYNDDLDQFIIKEKVATFSQVASGNIHDLIVTRKILVIYGFKESHEIVAQKQKRNEFKTQMRNYVNKRVSTLRDTFQFAWSNDLDLLSNIAVWTLDEPLIFLYDSVLHKYGIYPLSSITTDRSIQIEPILDYIVANHSQIVQFTGDAWTKRLFRPFWELYRTILSMFIEAPFISMLVIGLPAGVISVVCYFLCCLPSESSADGPASKQKKKAISQRKPLLRQPDGTMVEQDEEDGSAGDDDEEYEERIVHAQPKLIENWTKPPGARDIPTWPFVQEETSKTVDEKKHD